METSCQNIPHRVWRKDLECCLSEGRADSPQHGNNSEELYWKSYIQKMQMVVVLICSRELVMGASEEISQQSTGKTSRQVEEVEIMKTTGPASSSKMNNLHPLNILDQDKM